MRSEYPDQTEPLIGENAGGDNGYMASSKSRPVSLSARDAELDDLFEGELDPDVFAIRDQNDFDVVAAWLASRDPGASERQVETDEQSIPDPPVACPMASGAVGDGDVPFDECECGKRYRNTISDYDAAIVDERDSVGYASPTSGVVQNVTEPQASQIPDIRSYCSNSTSDMEQKAAHLAALNGEVFNKYRHDCDVYSSTASAETISVFEDETLTPSEYRFEDEGGTDETPQMEEQADRIGCVSCTEQVENDLKLESEKHEESDAEVLISESLHSALLQSKPHLSDVTPADTQGQHPGNISLSSHSSTSLASSSLNAVDPKAELRPLLETVHRGKHRSFPRLDVGASGDSYVPPRTNSQDLISTSDTSDRKSSILQFDVKPPKRKSESSSLTIPLDRGHNGAIGTNQQTSASVSASDSVPDQTHHQNTGSFVGPKQLSSDAQPKTFVSLLSVTPAPASGDQGGQLGQDVSPGGPELTGLPSRLDQPWQGLDLVPDKLGLSSPYMEVNATVDTVATREISMSSPDTSQLTTPSRHVDELDRSEDIAPVLSEAGKDQECSSARSANDVTSSSPPAGLQDAMHRAKRGSRKATASKRKATANSTSTRGRAVNTSPDKRRVTTSVKKAPAAGVQGEATKISKSRTAKSARVSSRKVTATVEDKKTNDDVVPAVPDLPEDMDLDLPELHFKPSSTQRHQQAEEENPEIAKRQGSERRSSARRSTTSTKTGSEEERVISQSSWRAVNQSEPVSGPSGSQLQVPKTRKSKPAAISNGIDAVSDKTDQITIITQTAEPTPMEIDIASPIQQPSLSNAQMSTADHEIGPTTPPARKQPTRRAATPSKVQKLTIRKNRTPAAATTAADAGSSGIKDVPGASANIAEPDRLTLKPRPAPRKATPSPRRRKQPVKALEEVVPLVPKTPERKVKKIDNTTPSPGKKGSRLTPQSAENEVAGSSLASPLRRSPRLSGKEPGPGL